MTRVEVAKDYLVSVAERTVGNNAYKRWQRFLGPEPSLSSLLTKDPIHEIGKYTNPINIHLLQICLPVFTESIARAFTESPDNFLLRSTKVVLSLEIDIATWLLILHYDGNWQIPALRLAANVVTHVGMDLGGAAINRIKTFRPSATTLAV